MDKLYTIYTSPPTNYIVYYKVLKKYRTNYVIRLLLGFYTFHTTTFTVEVFGEERAYKYAFPSGPLYIEIGPKRSLNYAPPPPPPSLYCSHHHICVYVLTVYKYEKRKKKITKISYRQLKIYISNHTLEYNAYYCSLPAISSASQIANVKAINNNIVRGGNARASCFYLPIDKLLLIIIYVPAGV